MKVLLRRGVSIVVSMLVIFGNVACAESVIAEESPEQRTNEYFIEDSTGTYEISTVIYQNGERKVEATNMDTEDKYVLKVDKKQIVLDIYDCQKDNKDLKKKVEKREIKRKRSQDDLIFLQAYTKKYKSGFANSAGHQYWYSTGKSGSDLGYVKIGCVATYKIKYKKVKSQLDNYMDYVDSARECRNSAIVDLTVAAVTDAAGIALGILSAGVGTGVTVAMISSSFAFSTASAHSIVKGSNYVIKAGRAYNLVKGYGTKL